MRSPLGYCRGKILADGVWRKGYRSVIAGAYIGTRIYEYEADLPGTVSIRPLYGSGWRGYAQVSCRWQRWTLSGRYRLQWDRRIRRYGGVQFDWAHGEIDKH